MKLKTILLLICLVLPIAAQPSPSSRYPQSVTFTIAQSGTTSAAVNMSGCTAAAIVTPAALTGTSFTFSASDDGATYTTLYEEFGNVKTITAGASRTILLNPAEWWSIRWLKIVSSGTEAAARTIKVICRN